MVSFRSTQFRGIALTTLQALQRSLGNILSTFSLQTIRSQSSVLGLINFQQQLFQVCQLPVNAMNKIFESKTKDSKSMFSCDLPDSDSFFSQQVERWVTIERWKAAESLLQPLVDAYNATNCSLYPNVISYSASSVSSTSNVSICREGQFSTGFY